MISGSSKPELFTEHFKRVGQIVTPDKFSKMLQYTKKDSILVRGSNLIYSFIMWNKKLSQKKSEILYFQAPIIFKTNHFKAAFLHMWKAAARGLILLSFCKWSVIARYSNSWLSLSSSTQYISVYKNILIHKKLES